MEWLKRLYQLTLKNSISLTSDAHAPSMLAFTILSTMPNNCIFPVILCNLAPYILRLQESVASLAYVSRGLPRQVNYLIDESVQIGKGANSVISYLHHFFDKHGLGETDVHVHADNCAGQNKNNYLLLYWAWRDHSRFPQLLPIFISHSWPHKICMRLVFWPVETKSKEDFYFIFV